MSPKDFCEKWVPRFYINERTGLAWVPGERGYRKVCTEFLGYVLKGAQATTINTWGAEFEKAPIIYNQTLMLTDIVWTFYFEIRERSILPLEEAIKLRAFR